MKVKNVKIQEIKPYENNPRDNDKAVEGVAKSLQEFGWQQPIVVDKDNVIIVGHTRYKAAMKLGYKEVPVTVADNLSPEKVKAYRLADNKTGENAVWNNKSLLKELDFLDDKKLFTGFDTSEIFSDILDEKDNSPIADNDKGVTYSISLKTQNKETYEKVKHFIDGVTLIE